MKCTAIDSTPCERRYATAAAHVGFVERLEDVAVGVGALAHLGAQLARDQRLELAGQAEQLRPRAARELEDVAEALRRDEPATRALALEHGVGRDRRAVDHALRAREIALQRLQAGHEADRLVVRRARHLRDRERAGRRIEHQAVGERAADVDADDQSGTSCARRRSAR